MKPAAFQYVRPASVAEAVDALAEHGDDASVLAGGQSLLPMMNLRLARPAVLVDINRVGGLDRVERDGDVLRVGALTRHRTLERLGATAQGTGFGILPAAARHIGHYPIRNRGTIGGSIAHADPAAELCVLAVAMGAEIVLEGPSGARVVVAEDFLQGALWTDRHPDELVTEVRFPRPPRAWAFHEFARRDGDFALVTVAVTVTGATGGPPSVRIAVGGVGGAPVRVPDAEAAFAERLGGATASDADIAELAAAGVDPVSDSHTEAWYRRHLVRELVARSLADVVAQEARSGPGPASGDGGRHG